PVGDAAIAVVAEMLRCVQIHTREQRVVVQHLLEVRYEPPRVDRVAVEAAADEVVHTACGHRVERASRHLLFAAAEEKFEDRRGRELWRPSEAAPGRVEDGMKALLCGVEQVGRERIGRWPQERT